MLSKLTESIGAKASVLFLCHFKGGQRMVILIIVEGLVIFIYADAPMEPPVCGMEVCGCPR